MANSGNDIRSAQYVAHCRGCTEVRSLTRAQIFTGRNPICEFCGDAMVVYLSGGGRAVRQEQRQAPSS
jgi:hypothetical protein